jgi:hypothetical protein
MTALQSQLRLASEAEIDAAVACQEKIRQRMRRKSNLAPVAVEDESTTADT